MPKSELSDGNPDVTNSSDATKEAPPSKVIADVHKQLINRFQPTVKTVAEAGVNLLRSFSSLQKSTDAYIKTIRALADSGSKACSEGKQAASELEEIASRMKSIQEKHEENIGLFSKLVTKMNSFSQGEKEVLKELHRGFEAREKAMKKAIHKGKKNEDELKQFYSKELQFAVKEQQRRYQFFVDKHNEWLFGYVNLLQFMIECCHYEASESKPDQQEENLNEQINEDRKAENASNSEEDKRDSIAEEKATTEEEEEHQDELEKRYLKKTDVMDGVLPENHETQTEGTQTKEGLDDEDTTEWQEKQWMMKQPEREREQLPQWKVRMSTDANQQQRRTADYTPEVQSRNVRMPVTSGVRAESPTRAGANAENEWEFRGAGDYENYRRPVSTAQSRYYPKQSTLERDEDRQSAAIENNAFKPSRTGQIRENGVMFRPQNVTAVPTAFIPPAFVPADYGKLLVCIHDFQGRTASQLSLGAGERVVLIKSGSKGWVFAKNVETQRTGWFPSRFVKLLPEKEVGSSS